MAVMDGLKRKVLMLGRLHAINAISLSVSNVEMNGMDILLHAKRIWRKNSRDGLLTTLIYPSAQNVRLRLRK